MLDQTTVKVDKQKFTLQQLPTTKGLEAVLAISHILAGAGQGFKDEFVLNIEMSHINIGKVVEGIINATDVKGTPQFIKQVIMDSVVKPELDDDSYETTFAGDYSLMFSLMSKIIEHNHFLDLLKKNIIPTMHSIFLEK